MLGLFLFFLKEELMAGTIEQRVEALIKPIVESMDLVLWGIRFRGSRDRAMLQIFIDKEGGVDADICGELTNIISPALDTEDIINPRYTLEVSSPGIDRILFTLDQFKMYINQVIKLELVIAQEGRKKFEGKLLEVKDDSSIVLEDKNTNNVYSFMYTNIHIARVVPVFNINDAKAGKK